MEGVSDSESSEPDEDVSEGFVMAVQHQQSDHPKLVRKTMRFKGLVGKHELLILLDSGSAGTFVSSSMAQQFPSLVQACDSQQFSTADGTPMVSDQYLPGFQWSIQGHSFTYDARVLPLKSFDMILGADWLADHSPTWIHWKKLMHFPLGGRRIKISGIRDSVSECKGISAHKLKGLLNRKAVMHMLEIQRVPSSAQSSSSSSSDQTVHSIQTLAVPPQISALVQQYDNVFQETADLPPQRPEDHHIPLVPGAQPVNIRPYRYSSAEGRN